MQPRSQYSGGVPMPRSQVPRQAPSRSAQNSFRQNDNNNILQAPLPPPLQSYVQSVEGQCDAQSFDQLPVYDDVPNWLSKRQNADGSICASGYDKIGEGSFGEVFRCKDPGSKSAIKVVKLPSHIDCRNSQSEREIPALLEQECHESKGDRCSFVKVNKFDRFRVGDRSYAAYEMPLLTGGSADKYLKNPASKIPDLPLPEFMENFISLLYALNHLHDLQFAHRDIKPENTLMDDHNRMYLADFGLSCYRSGVPGVPSDLQCQGIAGTLLYISWARLKGRSSDTFSEDIFALAITMIEILLRKRYRDYSPQRSSFETEADIYATTNSTLIHLGRIREKEVLGNPVLHTRWMYTLFLLMIMSNPIEAEGRGKNLQAYIDLLEREDDGFNIRAAFTAVPNADAPNADFIDDFLQAWSHPDKATYPLYFLTIPENVAKNNDEQESKAKPFSLDAREQWCNEDDTNKRQLRFCSDRPRYFNKDLQKKSLAAKKGYANSETFEQSLYDHLKQLDPILKSETDDNDYGMVTTSYGMRRDMMWFIKQLPDAVDDIKAGIDEILSKSSVSNQLEVTKWNREYKSFADAVFDTPSVPLTTLLDGYAEFLDRGIRLVVSIKPSLIYQLVAEAKLRDQAILRSNWIKVNDKIPASYTFKDGRCNQAKGFCNPQQNAQRNAQNIQQLKKLQQERGLNGVFGIIDDDLAQYDIENSYFL